MRQRPKIGLALGGGGARGIAHIGVLKVLDVDIEAAKIPFGAAAVDLVSGKQLVLRQGSIVRAVMASCAVPGFMPTVSWENMILVDGGILNTVPVRPLKEGGADHVIAVDVGSCLDQSCCIEDGIDAIQRAMEIMSLSLSPHGRQSAEVLLEPEVKGTDWTDFPNYEELIQIGEKEAGHKIKAIHKMLNYPLRKKVIQWPKKIYAGLEKRGQQIFRADSAQRYFKP